ncbi:hypothetical protein [Kitasatospora sp. NPDC058218]|uniref:hypothetical protein n=1 Tax=Kitasatospora sp. NPDC058218 TaxID=3346385 RepID=UPI0036DA6223
MRILKAEAGALHEDEPRTDAGPGPLPAIEPAEAAGATEPAVQRPAATPSDGQGGTSRAPIPV